MVMTRTQIEDARQAAMNGGASVSGQKSPVLPVVAYGTTQREHMENIAGLLPSGKITKDVAVRALDDIFRYVKAQMVPVHVSDMVLDRYLASGQPLKGTAQYDIVNGYRASGRISEAQRELVRNYLAWQAVRRLTPKQEAFASKSGWTEVQTRLDFDLAIVASNEERKLGLK